MNLPNLALKLPDMPRNVMISAALIFGGLVLFLVMFFTLGASLETAISDNARFTRDIAQADKDLRQSTQDLEFIQANKEKFEELMNSDRLVPHTRLTAVRQLQSVAVLHGLSALNYDFNAASGTSVAAVTSQPTTGDYRVNVEAIKLKVGSPLDGKIYAFLSDITDQFPGAAVVQHLHLERAPAVVPALLDMVSRGQNSDLVKGDIVLLWRTAQANENKAGDGKK